jgi:hypothetical protein
MGTTIDPRPARCRFRLRDEGKPYGRSGCTACGKTITTGLGTHCTAIPSVSVTHIPDGHPALDERAFAAATAAVKDVLNVEALIFPQSASADRICRKVASAVAQALGAALPADKTDAVAVPAGWKLVPVEPTEAMIEAGASGSGEDSEATAIGAWEAMLAAAHAPEVEPVAEVQENGTRLRWTEAGLRSGIPDGTKLYAAPPAPQPGHAPEGVAAALKEAQRLAEHMAAKFYPENPQWRALGDLSGVISQIDNMVTGLVRATPPAPQPEPDIWQHRSRLKGKGVLWSSWRDGRIPKNWSSPQWEHEERGLYLLPPVAPQSEPDPKWELSEETKAQLRDIDENRAMAMQTLSGHAPYTPVTVSNRTTIKPEPAADLVERARKVIESVDDGGGWHPTALANAISAFAEQERAAVAEDRDSWKTSAKEWKDLAAKNEDRATAAIARAEAAEKALDMAHTLCANPTVPRQSVGEVLEAAIRARGGQHG